MMRCKEVAGLLASDQLTAGGFMKRVSVALHLMICKHCSRFKRQIQQLGSAARRIAKATDLEGRSGGREPGGASVAQTPRKKCLVDLLEESE